MGSVPVQRRPINGGRCPTAGEFAHIVLLDFDRVRAQEGTYNVLYRWLHAVLAAEGMARLTSHARRRQPERPLAGNDGQHSAWVVIELSKRGDQLR